MSARVTYMVGGLLLAGLTPEMENQKLNECGRHGWELVNVCERKHLGDNYVFYYFQKLGANEDEVLRPRFDFDLCVKN